MYYSKKLWGASGGGGVVYNFLPLVAPESFTDPSKYADYGLNVNLYEKFMAYKMTWADADIAVEFSDATVSFEVAENNTTVEIFETVSGVETSVLRTTSGTHTFTSGSTKRYMIRRISSSDPFALPTGSVWAYCYGITSLGSYNISPYNSYLKYVFFYEHTLTDLWYFQQTGIFGTLYIPSGITLLKYSQFRETPITKVVTSNNLTTIQGTYASGAFIDCTSLQIADLGTGLTSIGDDTFYGCTSLASIICRAYNPPTLATSAFRGIPGTTNFYVPHERVDAYKMAAGWAAFASRIFSINDL